MKILYLAPKFDYGDQKRGLSFEHYNFFDTFYNTGNEIIYFDYLDILKKTDKKNMNRLLYDLFLQEKPDMVFVFLFENELNQEIMDKISKSGRTITLCWFADDHWRFENYSRYWASRFNWSVTTDINSVEKYKLTGNKNVILTQWGCNHFRYNVLDLPDACDTSFVGQKYGNREEVIDMIRDSGIEVHTRGQGWPMGRADQDEMIRIFNQTAVNLNIANASMGISSGLLSLLDRNLLYRPIVRRFWKKIRSVFLQGKMQPLRQIKGRNFEIPGCGGFLLTDYVPGLENYYNIGKDIICYNNIQDMIDKIEYFLKNENERQEIALRGYKVTCDRHTYVHRFNEIFKEVGLGHTFSLEKTEGIVREITEEV